MIPDWLVAIALFLGVGIGWISRIHYEAEAKRDEQIIDNALTRAYQAGWRSRHDD